MLADGIIQTTTGTGVAGASLALSAVTLGGLTLPTFASKFAPGTYGDTILFAVRRADSPIFQFAALGHLSDSTTLVIDRVLSTWDGTTADDTSPTGIALANGVNYYIYPTAEAGAMAGLWPTILGDGSTADTRRALLCHGAAALGGSTITLTANTLYSWPARWPTADTLKRLYVGVTTAVAGSFIRAGIWAMRHDGSRGRLLADSGVLSGAAATLVGATVPEVRLPVHGIWVGVMADAGVGLRAYVPSEAGALGWASAAAHYYNAFGTAARMFATGLPDPLPNGPVLTSAGAASQAPAVWGGV